MAARIKIARIEESLLSDEPIVEQVVDIEEPAEEIVVAPAVTEDDAAKKKRAPAKPFDYKIVTADEITQDRYNELKNFAMQ